MEDFLNRIKEERENENKNSVTTDETAPEPKSLAVVLEEFKKDFSMRAKWIGEFIIEGDYEISKKHVSHLGNELAKIFEMINYLEKQDKEDCGCP